MFIFGDCLKIFYKTVGSIELFVTVLMYDYHRGVYRFRVTITEMTIRVKRKKVV